MINWLTYLLQVSVCQAIFYFLYFGFFRNLSFFQVNRAFLLSATFISLIIPAINIPFWNKTSPGLALSFTKNLQNEEHSLTSPLATDFGVTASTIDWQIAIISIIYFAGIAFHLWKLYGGIRKVLRLVHNNEIHEQNGIRTVYLQDGPSFFAFLNYVFVNLNNLNISSSEFQQVFDHERAHIKQRHTIDNLFMEVAILICWFNPILRIMKTELNNMHEFYADWKGVGAKGNIEAYSRLILLLASSEKSRNHLTHQFSMKNIKKRIIMLNKPKTQKSTSFRYLMIAPCLAFLLVTFSFTEKSVEVNNDVSTTHIQTIGSISWKGNTRYTDKFLSEYLALKKGDPFSEEVINEKINYKPEGGDLTSLYMDQGYLFFTVEIKKERHDGVVDLVFEIYEGDVITVNKVLVTGHEKVEPKKILKMIDLKKGDLFSRSKLISSQRKIASSGLFDPENVIVSPIPHPADKTVDIEFTLSEL